MHQQSTIRSTLPWLGIAAIVILLDQLSKQAIVNTLQLGDARPVTGFFSLALAYNPGAAFTFLGDQNGWQRYLFTAIALFAVGFMFHLLRRHMGQRTICWALALIMGGAIGNVIDRIRYGHVIDFLDFYWSGWGHFATFNLADSAITLGVILFIVHELRRMNQH